MDLSTPEKYTAILTMSKPDYKRPGYENRIVFTDSKEELIKKIKFLIKIDLFEHAVYDNEIDTLTFDEFENQVYENSSMKNDLYELITIRNESVIKLNVKDIFNEAASEFLKEPFEFQEKHYQKISMKDSIKISTENYVQ